MQQTAVARLFNERTGDIVLRGVGNKRLSQALAAGLITDAISDTTFTALGTSTIPASHTYGFRATERTQAARRRDLLIHATCGSIPALAGLQA